ncbi:hypothetical protein Q5424_10140 [Conexibacter sp. JD483]|uniref:hypothetical protein n=1 Tax=unclassified Conexibacter TaxID=2627773 RepID=UPI0027156EE4|nr:MULTISPECIES: hypothetical protein [unclassified Conexibacter]MDO8188335.1 hypothetical protein [Conexibacter sp. CPCC 205706]MDO8200717.1 hypothetical protein [Conexibacter sp. CPCC 205762]MDR9369441.1 hypothetical protein [Conexibacter sp. JD483]
MRVAVTLPLALLALAAAAAPPAATAAQPKPGLWMGQKGAVKISFVVRAQGSRRTIGNVVVFCGRRGTEPFYKSPFAIEPDGSFTRWSRTPRRSRLGATSGVVDSPLSISSTDAAGRKVSCDQRAFTGIAVKQGPLRPIQDGTYAGRQLPGYSFSFKVRGGGVLLTDWSGIVSVPGLGSLTGYCGSGGDLGDGTRIAADGSFAFEDLSPGQRIAFDGSVGATSAGGSYSVSFDRGCDNRPLSGSAAWSATLTEKDPAGPPVGGGDGGDPDAPRPLPPGPEGAPDAPDPKPARGNGYGGPPARSRAAGCSATVSAGPVSAISACFRTRGTRAESTSRVRLNGLDLTPARKGVTVAIDRRSHAVTADGPVELRVGSLSLTRSELNWRRPEAVFEISGRSGRRDPGARFTTGGQALFGMPVKGSAKLRLAGGRTALTVSLTIPKDDGAVSLLSGYSGELTAAADNARGLVLDGASIAFPGMRAGFVEIQSAKLAVSQPGGSYRFDGRATVFPFRMSGIGIAGQLGFGLGDGYFKLGAAAENLNRALVYGFFLQRIGFSVQVNPFGLGGEAAVTFGPQFRLDGGLVSAARLDGSLSYLAGRGGDPAALTIAGALELAEAKAADGRVTVAGDGGVTAKGSFGLTVGGYGLKGGLDGWFDGVRAFNVEGRAQLSLPGPDASGEAILSSVGAGACRTGPGPDVGFGYRWGKGVDGLTFAAGSCSLGEWRAQRGARAAAAAGGHAVTVARGQKRLALQIRGAGGAPTVAIVAPGNRRIDPSAAPDGEVSDARTLFVRDPDTRATYLIVDRPAAGRWRVETLPGSVGVAGLSTARALPRVAVRARVSGRARRLLSFRFRGLAGRRVQLVERARGAAQVLPARGRASGSVRFTPLPAGGRHTVTAVMLSRAGVPTGERLRVATFRSGSARPPAPRRVRVLKRGSTRRVTWRGPARLRYEVAVRISDGRRMLLLPRGRARVVTVPTVARRTVVRVTVRARDAAGRASRPVRAKG